MSISLAEETSTIRPAPRFRVGAATLLSGAALAGFALYWSATRPPPATIADIAPLVKAPEEPARVRPVAESAAKKPEPVRAAQADPAAPAAKGDQKRDGKGDPKSFVPLTTRVVRTISIRPDGSPIDPREAAAPPKRAADVQPAPRVAQAAPSATPAPAAAATPARLAAAPVPVSQTPPAPAQTAQAPSPPVYFPVPQAAPAPQPAPVPVARAPEQRYDTTPVGSIRPASAPRGEGFSIQLASAGSEDEARQLARRFQGQYAEDLGQRGLTVVQGAVKDRTVYRVRLADLSKDEANALCARLRNSKAACFVARD